MTCLLTNTDHPQVLNNVPSGWSLLIIMGMWFAIGGVGKELLMFDLKSRQVIARILIFQLPIGDNSWLGYAP